jgi:hypothetical protein
MPTHFCRLLHQMHQTVSSDVSAMYIFSFLCETTFRLNNTHHTSRYFFANFVLIEKLVLG